RARNVTGVQSCALPIFDEAVAEVVVGVVVGVLGGVYVAEHDLEGAGGGAAGVGGVLGVLVLVVGVCDGCGCAGDLAVVRGGVLHADELGAEGCLAAVGADLEHVVLVGADEALADGVGAVAEVLDVVEGDRGGGHHLHLGAAGPVLAGAQLGGGGVEGVGALHV